jgi:hypothetical protein
MRAPPLRISGRSEPIGVDSLQTRESPGVSGPRNLLTGTERPTSISSRLRLRRFQMLLQLFPDLEEMRVVDLGGRPATWEQLPKPPRQVVCVNLEHHESPAEWNTTVTGDIFDPSVISGLGRFDLAYSNSTIEHVGGHARRLEFVRLVRALAPRYWVQTPNRYFPIEPHAVFPGFQFLPTRLQRAIARRWPLSPLGTDGDLLEEILSIDLLSSTELRFYFPDGQIWKERVAGLTKSLVAHN